MTSNLALPKKKKNVWLIIITINFLVQDKIRTNSIINY